MQPRKTRRKEATKKRAKKEAAKKDTDEMQSYLNAVVEGVLLFLNLQCEHLSRPALKQLRPRLSVAIDTETQPSASNALTVAHKLQIKILVTGLGAYFLDGTAFIKHICHYYPCLCQQPTGNEAPVMEVLCRRTGEPGRVTRYTLEAWGEGSADKRKPVIQEAVSDRPYDLHPAALLVKMMMVSEDDYKATGAKLGKFLHMIQLVNPEVSLSVCAKDSSRKPILQMAFDTTQLKTSKRAPRLVISVNHYTKERPRLSKLKLWRGDTQTLPNSSLMQNGGNATLKLFSMVALLPQLQLKKGRKLPINRLCQRLNIFVYGPYLLPLVPPGSQPNLPLSLIADWECYGLSLSPTNILDYTDSQVAIPSYVCEISNSRQQSTCRSTLKHTLILFLFLEDSNASEEMRLNGNIRWRQQMECVYKHRGELQELIMHHTKKFQQATHSALNKMACNYGSHSKTKAIMNTALPLLADAVASIVQHSRDESFRDSCMESLQVSNVDGVCSSVEHRLWRIAKRKLGIMHPTETFSKNPDEPTTPELALAVQNEQTGSQVAQHKTDTPPTNEISPLVASLFPSESTFNLTHSKKARQERNDHQATELEASSQNTQSSLFRARVSFKKSESQDKENTTSLTDDDTSFDSLLELDETVHFEPDNENSSQIEFEETDTQVSQVSPLFNYNSEIDVTDSQLSQPLIGVGAPPLDDQNSNIMDSEGEMSISSFDELENCSESESFMITEAMRQDESDLHKITGYDTLRDDTMYSQTEKEAMCMAGHTIHFDQTDEILSTAAALPKTQARVDHTDSVQETTGSDEEWDSLLAYESTVIPKYTQATKVACYAYSNSTTAEPGPLAESTHTNTLTDCSCVNGFSVLDIDDNDFNWD